MCESNVKTRSQTERVNPKIQQKYSTRNIKSTYYTRMRRLFCALRSAVFALRVMPLLEMYIPEHTLCANTTSRPTLAFSISANTKAQIMGGQHTELRSSGCAKVSQCYTFRMHISLCLWPKTIYTINSVYIYPYFQFICKSFTNGFENGIQTSWDSLFFHSYPNVFVFFSMVCLLPPLHSRI